MAGHSEHVRSPLAELLVGTLPARSAEDRPARFALEVGPGQDPRAVAAAVQADLSPIDALVAPLSELDHEVLVVELPGVTLDGCESPRAFHAAYALADGYGVRTAEPDLPTAFFPEVEVREPGAPVVEGLGEFPGCTVPDEPALRGTPRWPLDRLRVPEAWAYSRALGRPAQGAGIVVAQPDTGITAHAELVGVRSAGGWDILDSDADPTDHLGFLSPGHGTGTASVLVSPETLAVTGSAPQVGHLPIRAVESIFRITQLSVAQAIDWAVGRGAHVITMSLGGVPAVALLRALQRAVRADVIVMAAAGNCVRLVVWPARYGECLAVAGTSSTDQQWPGTCRGAAVDVSAPAQNVLRAAVPDGAGPGNAAVGPGQGTSYAVALTAGVAALWLAHHGRADLVTAARARGETLQEMFLRLVRATARRPPGWNASEMGAGIVDARALLEAGLDLGRDRAAVSRPDDPAERAALTVRSLVAETAGSDAVEGGVTDWHRYGPELATVVLERRTALPRAGAAAATPATSPELAGAVGNPRLRDLLGLPDRPA